MGNDIIQELYITSSGFGLFYPLQLLSEQFHMNRKIGVSEKDKMNYTNLSVCKDNSRITAYLWLVWLYNKNVLIGKQ